MKAKTMLTISAVLASVTAYTGCSAQSAEIKYSAWASDIINSCVESGITAANSVTDYTESISHSEFDNLVYDYLNRYGISVSADIINQEKYDPDSPVTREEAAKTLYSICKQAGITDVYETRLLSSFMFFDESEMSEACIDAIYNLSFHGIMKGTGDDRFSPKESCTYEQTIAALSRLFSLIPQNSDNSFADLLNANADKTSNYMLSPLSAKMALALAANGADGETRSEIIKAVGIDNLNSFNAGSEKIIEKYSKSDIIKLNISNSVWINESNNNMSFSKGYKKLISDYYNASADTVTNNDALSRINGWVEKSTNGKINSIIDKTDFDSILINAIYFKGSWRNKFEKSATAKGVFNERGGNKTEIDFMNTTDHFNNAYTGGVKIVELPYSNSSDIFDKSGNYVRTDTLEDTDISMFVLMPDDDKSINPCEIIENAKKENALTYSEISLYMPKFKIEYSQLLNDTLKSAGINKAFTAQADFSPMFDDGSMFIDKVLQKTYIDVDENGTEAAAVTAVVMECTSAMPSEPEVIRIDKPFTFVIMENTSNEPLFVGEYAFAK